MPCDVDGAEQLKQVEKRIANGEHRIAEQLRSVTVLRLEGRETASATQTLQRMQDACGEMVRLRNDVIQAMAEIGDDGRAARLGDGKSLS